MTLSSLFAYRGTSSGRSELVLGVCAFVGFIAVWTALSEFEFVPQRFLPLPWEVLKALWGLFAERNFHEDVGISVTRVWGAFLLSVVTAVPIGVWMSSYRAFGALIEPIVPSRGNASTSIE